jgi:hypothetical protein
VETEELLERKRKQDEMGRACSENGEEKNAYGILVGKAEAKRLN